MASNPFAALIAGQSGGLDAGGPATIPNFPSLQPPAAAGGSAPAQLPSAGGPQPQSATSFVRQMDVPSAQQEHAPIKKLGPDTPLLKKTIDKLDAMFKFSADEMKKHYHRWNYNEQKVQAYVHTRDYERICQTFNRPGSEPPEPVSVVVPYTYATLHTAATFVSGVLLGRKPVFPLLATRGTQTERARYMEQALQYNLDASRGMETLWQMIWDSILYGFGTTRNGWETREGPTIQWVGGQREQTTTTTFAGNVIGAVDPYAYFPDPRVPIHECNSRGDFIFTQMEQSETVLRDMEKRGELMWVKEAIEKAKQLNRRRTSSSEARRRLKIGIRGEMLNTPTNVIGFQQLREGTVRLVPKDWGLGESDRSEIWKFTWMERGQIMQAEPLGMIHQQHPYSASEPMSLGHDFMSLSMADMVGTFQDILSWLVSSKMENVRAAINNQFIADPGRVDLNDIRSSPIGRIIRLKQAAMGLPIDQAIQQLLVQDVTQGHLNDIQTIRILADTITGVNDNLRGIQNPGGRKSATEARLSMQSGGNRLSQLAIRISSQGLMPMVNQMIMNVQQFMPDQMWIESTGDDTQPYSQQLTAEMLVGSFNYQISDGTLPFDKTAMVEVWKEILFGIAQDPELRQAYSLPQIFRYVAELGGAKNIDSFTRQPPQPGTPIVAGAAQEPGAAPNAVPVGPAMPAHAIFGR